MNLRETLRKQLDTHLEEAERVGALVIPCGRGSRAALEDWGERCRREGRAFIAVTLYANYARVETSPDPAADPIMGRITESADARIADLIFSQPGCRGSAGGFTWARVPLASVPKVVAGLVKILHDPDSYQSLTDRMLGWHWGAR